MALWRRLILSALSVAALTASCGTSSRLPSDPMAGTYDVKGGGAALDVFQALSDAFRRQHPSVKFNFEDVGSSAGMKLASNGQIDLATSSALPAADIVNTVTVVPVGVSGTAVIVSATNRVAALTKSQVRDVFSGQVTDWSAVGGQPDKIIVVIRESTSALRSNFDAYFFGGKGTYRSDAIQLNSGDDVLRAVTSGSNVVSMITITNALLSDQRVHALSIDGIAATKDNIVLGRYPVVRPLFLVYNEKHLKPAIAAFLDFVRSADGQHIIELATVGG